MTDRQTNTQKKVPNVVKNFMPFGAAAQKRRVGTIVLDKRDGNIGLTWRSQIVRQLGIIWPKRGQVKVKLFSNRIWNGMGFSHVIKQTQSLN